MGKYFPSPLMIRKQYYSQRTGKIDNVPLIDFELLKRLFLSLYIEMSNEGYFQKYFGYYCVDQGEVFGVLGRDISVKVFFNLRKDNLWPLNEKIQYYSEDELFSIIEFLHDHCSKPLEGDYHSWNDCGMHYTTFDDKKGQSEFRNRTNILLADYLNGFELSEVGEILSLPDSNLEPLLNAVIPSEEEENVTLKVDNAVLKFRRHKASLDDRKNALRELADVLEYLRPSIKEALMNNDEKDIFNLANNFGIRHHNANQKVKYDKAIWYSWMFYYYLATIHASIRLIEKQVSDK